MRARIPWIEATLVCVHVGLVLTVAGNTTPSTDEPAHLASGIYHWQTGRFDAYRVNPPFVRLWCSWPVALFPDITTFRPRSVDHASRIEWQLDDQLLGSCGYPKFRKYLWIARVSMLPLVVLGGLYCYFWASAIAGPLVGRISWMMWIFSPNILAWSATIYPDVPAVSLGIAASFHFRNASLSQRSVDYRIACIYGGLAALAKMTWILLPPMLIMLDWLAGPRNPVSNRLRAHAKYVLMWLIIVNLGYGLGGTGRRIGTFDFQSRLFSGERHGEMGNRFKGSRMGWLPVMLPSDMVLGLDQQRFEFERGKWSYHNGQWRRGSWYYYYAACAAWKMPEGYLLLIGWTLILSAAKLRRIMTECEGRRNDCDWDAMLLMGLASGFAVIVSSQTGFGHHFRYAFPCLPYLYVLSASSCFSKYTSRTIRRFASGALAVGFVSSVAAVPLNHSYFNMVAHLLCDAPPLLESNLDWGEDLVLAERWFEQKRIDRRTFARPIFHAVVTTDLASRMSLPWQPATRPDQAGWYIVSRQRILDPRDPFHVLRTWAPKECLGNSLVVYQLTPHDVLAINREGSP